MADLMHFHPEKKSVSFRKLLSFFFVIALPATAAIQKPKAKRHSTTMWRWMKVNAFWCRVNLHRDVYFSILHPTRKMRLYLLARRMLSQCSKPILFVVKKKKQKQHVWRISSSDSFTTFHFLRGRRLQYRLKRRRCIDRIRAKISGWRRRMWKPISRT